MRVYEHFQAKPLILEGGPILQCTFQMEQRQIIKGKTSKGDCPRATWNNGVESLSQEPNQNLTNTLSLPPGIGTCNFITDVNQQLPLSKRERYRHLAPVFTVLYYV